MKSKRLVEFLTHRKIALLLFMGLFVSILTHAVERPEQDRKVQMKKQKAVNSINVRDCIVKKENADEGQCIEYACKPCRLVKKGTTGTYKDQKKIACPSNDLTGSGCDFDSSSECGDSDSPNIKL